MAVLPARMTRGGTAISWSNSPRKVWPCPSWMFSLSSMLRNRSSSCAREMPISNSAVSPSVMVAVTALTLMVLCSLSWMTPGTTMLLAGTWLGGTSRPAAPLTVSSSSSTVSSTSSVASSVTATSMVPVFSPGSKVRVPLVAV